MIKHMKSMTLQLEVKNKDIELDKNSYPTKKKKKIRS